MFSIAMTLLGLSILLEDLADGSDRMKNTEPGMRRVVREVVLEEVNTNFMVGGRPSWEPLAQDTLKQRAYQLAGYQTLIKTGNLLEEATNLDNWSFSQDEATFVLPENAEYGYVHEEGSSDTPARPFMLVPEEALARMDEIMNDWVQDGRE